MAASWYDRAYFGSFDSCRARNMQAAYSSGRSGRNVSPYVAHAHASFDFRSTKGAKTSRASAFLPIAMSSFPSLYSSHFQRAHSCLEIRGFIARTASSCAAVGNIGFPSRFFFTMQSR